MDKSVLLKSFAIGLSMAIPLGPVGMLCLKRGLLRGGGAALASGIGSSFADVPYVAMARLGVAGLAAYIAHEGPWLRVLALAFIAFLALKLFSRSEEPGPPDAAGAEYRKMCASTFLLGVSNPSNILGPGALLSVAGLPPVTGWPSAALPVIFVLTGSLTWWAGCSFVLSRSRTRASDRTVRRFTNFASAGILIVAATGLFFR